MKNSILEISAIRSLVKRSFPNDSKTIINEILQNSQRSGATEIGFQTDKNCITIEDNGSGIADLSNLIVLGKSEYEKAVIDHQHPVGVGFYSLLAHDEISSVTVSSQKQSIAINTQQWWQNDSYAENWKSLVKESNVDRGVKIEISATTKFVRAFENSFIQNKTSGKISSGQGYSLVDLKIKLNQNEIDAGYPKWVENEDVLFLGRYEGNALIVYSSPFGTRARFSVINWYGQLIEIETELPFGFLYEVSEGRPLEPQAPVRKEIIRDEKWQAFIDYLVATIAKHFSERVERPNQYDVEAYYNLQKQYPKIPDCPFYTAARALGYDEQHGESVEREGDIEVFRYSDRKLVDGKKPRLIEDCLYVDYQDTDLILECEDMEGYESFIRLLDEPLYLPKIYHRKLLPELEAFWWRPGEIIKTDCGYNNLLFANAGTYALTNDPDLDVWQPVSKDVFAISDRTACCADALRPSRRDDEHAAQAFVRERAALVCRTQSRDRTRNESLYYLPRR